jgi:CTP synthase (UTP-ammonia lyase)
MGSIIDEQRYSPAMRIGLIGDYDETIKAHQAIPQAIARASEHISLPVEPYWIHSTAVREAELLGCDGVWCVPGSPYANMDGALAAIRWARERSVPFLGTCGGFQHAIIEYARTVLGLREADHAESNPNASLPVIAPLSCALRGASATVHFIQGSRVRAIYGEEGAVEGYQCGFGLNPEIQSRILAGSLAVAAVDDEGQVRAIEHTEHPFFLATLFQPELSALTGRTHPLVVALVSAAGAKNIAPA